ncbi:MAG TPA: endonuclease/exonuclease/phosphatase family protein [Acidimicrobiia bacterium]|nr:endonuclease/exonuclease/phosphatase family protein [Acidimicrobiia bacterium]
MTTEFTVASFNAHWGLGRFGDDRGVRFDLVDIIRGFDADLVVVAESYRFPDGKGILDPLENDGYRVESLSLMDLALRHDRNLDTVPSTGAWELAVCSRLPVLDRRDLPIGVINTDPPGPRSAIALRVDVAGTAVQLVGVHTSSKVWRLAPVRHLLALRKQLDAGGPQILAGDFNFWGPPVGLIFRGWKRPVRGRTYPSRMPHSQIDHVLVRGGIEPISAEVLARTASDHLPIRARLRV